MRNLLDAAHASLGAANFSQRISTYLSKEARRCHETVTTILRTHAGEAANGNLTRSANWAQVIGMRKGGAFVVTAMLAAEPFSVFGKEVVFPPNPIGMKLYQAHHVIETLALSIIVCAFLLGCLLHLARRNAKSTTSEDAGSWDI